MADRARHGVQQPVRIKDHQVRIGCGLGGTLWPLDHAQLDGALELADRALYRAGRNWAEFQEAAGNSA